MAKDVLAPSSVRFASRLKPRRLQKAWCARHCQSSVFYGHKHAIPYSPLVPTIVEGDSSGTNVTVKQDIALRFAILLSPSPSSVCIRLNKLRTHFKVCRRANVPCVSEKSNRVQCRRFVDGVRNIVFVDIHVLRIVFITTTGDRKFF